MDLANLRRQFWNSSSGCAAADIMNSDEEIDR